MYICKDTFRAYDANKQPYSFSVERHTETANLHAWVEGDAFHLASIGNRHILNTPAFCQGTFEMAFHFNYMEVYDPGFTVLFHYDEATRKGHGLQFLYHLDTPSFDVSLIAVNKSRKTVLSSQTVPLHAPLTEAPYLFVLEIGTDCVSGTFADAPFSVPCPMGKGKLAIERHEYLGELIIDRIAFSSPDSFDTERIQPEITVEIPTVNGGDLPYTVTWSLDRIEGEYYLTARLDGGTRTRPVNREDRPGQYVAEKDWMVSPYIGLVQGNHRETYAIATGERAFIDPNIYWDCQKELFDDTALPIVNTYRIPAHLIAPDTAVLFGYESLYCTGYACQTGGCEFRYNWDGTLNDYGAPMDGSDFYEVLSQEDKLALDFVPEDCYRRDEVIAHIKNNHYFDISETPHFTLVMHTCAEPGYLTVKAEILNVYETQTLYSFTPSAAAEKEKLGYHRISFSVDVPQMALGVWKVAFTVMYGGKLYHRTVKTFEVFDQHTDRNPALESGLPFTFSMPNEQKRLMRNSFDLWNPAKSCDVEHYITCITDTPVEAETRQSWRLCKPFKREWFAWLTSRTCTDWQVENHLDTVKNADYLFASWQEKFMDLSQSGLYPIRQDHHDYNNYMRRASARIPVLDDFLHENPEIAAKVDYKPGTENFTRAQFIELMRVCAAEWIEYQNRRGMEIIRAHNRELLQINPDFRRSLYGPINAYVTPTLTAHSLKAYGFSDFAGMAKDAFSGFCVFEDYPYSCSYQTYRGAFMVMMILLESPDLVLYPEQYDGSRGGCIDGAVKFAHAPMGAYSILPYQNSTHAFEFVFNTPYRLSDGYHYWNTYGFHRSDCTDAFMNRLVLDWRYVAENKPKKPLRTTAFLAEYTDREDQFTVFAINDNEGGCYINNRTELGHGVLYECSREAGIPAGFALKYDALLTLSADECDVLILPNLAYADRAVIQKIRELYEGGVNLIAVSQIDGLEDIFGVQPDRRDTTINRVDYNGEREFVRENDAVLYYTAVGAGALMTSDRGDALALATERTLLLNTSIVNLGCEDAPTMNPSNALHTVGRLVRQMLCDALRQLSHPLVLGENVGTTLFETEDGRRELLVIDYTPFDNREPHAHQAVVKLNMPDVTAVRSDKDLFIGTEGGMVKEIRFEILPHESVFVDLIY